MAAYVIVQIDVTDPERYAAYLAPAKESIDAAGGRYVVRGSEFTVLEGQAPPGRTVVLEFPDRQAALDWYASESYQHARRLRAEAATVAMYVIDGVD